VSKAVSLEVVTDHNLPDGPVESPGAPGEGERLLTVRLLATSARPRHHPRGARNATAITGGNRPRNRWLYDARTLGRECGG
jgi:hypothetical protein